MARRNFRKIIKSSARLVMRLSGFLLLGGIMACAAGSSLRLVSADLPAEDGRRYRLFLYGAMDSNDFETLAILDREDDRFSLVSHAGAHRVTLLEGLSIGEAQNEARRFLGRINGFHGLDSRAIIGVDGRALGYEIRGSYSPPVGRKAEDLETTYLAGSDDAVIFYVYYPPEVGRDGESFPSLHGH